MLKAGLIGVGGYGAVHRRALAELKQRGSFALEAGVIHDPRLLAAEERELASLGVRIYRSAEELIDAEQGTLDLITVATGIPLHREHSVAALEAGYHVLCEKPLAGSLADAQAIGEAADRAGARGGSICAVGYQRIHQPRVTELVGLVQSGELGRLRAGRCLVLWPRTVDYYRRNEWAGRMTTPDGRVVNDSPLQNACSHYLFAMLYVASVASGTPAVQPTEIYAEHYRTHRIQSADTQFLRVALAQTSGVAANAILSVFATHASAATINPLISLHFEHADVCWPASGPISVLYHTERDAASGHATDRYDSIRLIPDSGDAVAEMYADLAGAIADRRSPLVTVERAMMQTACVERAFADYPIAGIASAEIEGDALAPAIRGIEDTAPLWLAQGAGPKELGLRWATTARP